MLKVKVNNKEYEISKESDWDIIEQGDTFHILKDFKSYRCVLLSKDDNLKNMTISVNDTPYTINIKDQNDLLLEKMGMSDITVKRFENVKAPMPGLVLSIKVKEGDSIAEGDTLLVLEAMKMENMLKSSGTGVIKKILVKEKEAVEKGQILIEMQ